MARLWPGALANPATLDLHGGVAAALGEPIHNHLAGWIATLDMD
jgi:hypothetical protein